VRDPDDPQGWRLSWHGEPDEATMRQHAVEAMSEVAKNFTISITSYVRQPINFDQLAEDAMAAADPHGRLSRADRRDMIADARKRLREAARQGGWGAVRAFVRHAGDRPLR
jgi:hypothetical protein